MSEASEQEIKYRTRIVNVIDGVIRDVDADETLTVAVNNDLAKKTFVLGFDYGVPAQNHDCDGVNSDPIELPEIQRMKEIHDIFDPQYSHTTTGVNGHINESPWEKRQRLIRELDRESRADQRKRDAEKDCR